MTLKVIFLFFVCHNSHQLFIRATCNFRTSAQTTYVEDEKNEYLFSYLCTQITLYYYIHLYSYVYYIHDADIQLVFFEHYPSIPIELQKVKWGLCKTSHYQTYLNKSDVFCLVYSCLVEQKMRIRLKVHYKYCLLFFKELLPVCLFLVLPVNIYFLQESRRIDFQRIFLSVMALNLRSE